LRAYFAPCGIGLGHVSRCVSILHKLREEEDVKAIFATYAEGLNYARELGLRTYAIPELKYAMKPWGEIDVERTLMDPGLKVIDIISRQAAHDLKGMLALRPDIVISDTRAVALLAAASLGIPSICILNQFRAYVPRRKRLLRLSKLADAGFLAIMGSIWSLAHHIFVPDYPDPFTICRGNIEVPEYFRKKLRLVGPILARRPEELPSQEELKEELGFEEGKPLIFVSASGTKEERAYFVKMMVRLLSCLKNEFQAVISLSEPHKGERVLKHDGGLRVFYWVEDYLAYLKACDIAILRGGHSSIMQCMAYGKPMLLVPTPSHTEKMMNALRAREVGVAKVLLQRELELRKLKEALGDLLEDKRYRRAVRKAYKMASNLNAVGEIVKAVKELAGSG